jgi:hypothetical protein
VATNNSINASTNSFLQVANNLSDVGSATSAFGNISPLTTKGDIIVFSGSANVRLAVGTDGQVLTARSGATNGVDWESPSLLPWTVVSGTSQSAAVNNGYVSNNAGVCTITLPSTAAVGSAISVTGLGAGGWKIAQNASQLVNFGDVVTTTGTGGSLASTNQYDSIELICIVANTTWKVMGSIGNITYV